jgi:hypothetical protein
MLIIIMNDRSQIQVKKDDPIPGVAGMDIVSLVADGEWLETIRREFSGIHMTRGKVLLWVGDDARFIYANLFVSQMLTKMGVEDLLKSL